jgi:hypothetical protein
MAEVHSFSIHECATRVANKGEGSKAGAHPQALEPAIEEQVLAPGQLLPEQVVLRADADAAVDGMHVPPQVQALYHCAACAHKAEIS